MTVLYLIFMVAGNTSSKNCFFEEFSRLGLCLLKLMEKGRWLRSSKGI